MTHTPGDLGSSGSNETRVFAVRAIGITLAAAGAWFGLARPLVAEVADQRAELVVMNIDLGSDPGAGVTSEKIDDALAGYRASLEQVEAWTIRPSESGMLYDRIRNLANHLDVRIERIEPKNDSELHTAHRTRKPDERSLVTGRSVGYALDVTGRFEAVSRFIASCESQLGSSKIVSFRITPSVRSASANEPSVLATIETQHICLNILIPAQATTTALAEEKP